MQVEKSLQAADKAFQAALVQLTEKIEQLTEALPGVELTRVEKSLRAADEALQAELASTVEKSLRAAGEALQAELASTVEKSLRAADEGFQTELESTLEAWQEVDEKFQAGLDPILEAWRGADKELQEELARVTRDDPLIALFPQRGRSLMVRDYLFGSFTTGAASALTLSSTPQPLLSRPVPEADREPNTALASTGAAVREYVRSAFDTLKEETAEKDE